MDVDEELIELVAEVEIEEAKIWIGDGINGIVAPGFQAGLHTRLDSGEPSHPHPDRRAGVHAGGPRRWLALSPRNSDFAADVRSAIERAKARHGTHELLRLHKEGNLYNLYLKQRGAI